MSLEKNSHRIPWEARKPIATAREVFDFEYQFSLIIQKRTSKTLSEIIPAMTWELKNYSFNSNTEMRTSVAKPDIDWDNLVEYAFKKSLEENQSDITVPYYIEFEQEPGARFGCFYSTSSRLADAAMGIHFTNCEFDKASPLSVEKIPNRQQELHDVFADIKNRFPDTKYMCGKSWLYNLPAYRRLFPDSYLENLLIDEDVQQWGHGSTIWGQFYAADGSLKIEKASSFLEQLKELPVNRPLSTLYHQDGALLPPHTAIGPIEDFYKMYNVD